MVANTAAAPAQGRLHIEPPPASDRYVNIGSSERMVTGLIGGGLVLLGLARRSVPGMLVAGLGGILVQRAATGHCAGYQALGVTGHEATSHPLNRRIHVERSVTISRSAEDLFKFWRNFENLPRFMTYLESVQVRSDKESHWIARGPRDMPVEWDATITDERPNELIAWKTTSDGQVAHTGSVHFQRATGDRGTVVKVILDYTPTGGVFGAAAAKLMGRDPASEIASDLIHFKQLIEAGEIATTVGQSRCGGQQDWMLSGTPKHASRRDVPDVPRGRGSPEAHHRPGVDPGHDAGD